MSVAPDIKGATEGVDGELRTILVASEPDAEDCNVVAQDTGVAVGLGPVCREGGHWGGSGWLVGDQISRGFFVVSDWTIGLVLSYVNRFLPIA